MALGRAGFMRVVVVRAARTVIVEIIAALLNVLGLLRLRVLVRVLVRCRWRAGHAANYRSGPGTTQHSTQTQRFSAASPVHKADTGTAQIFLSSCNTIAPL